MAQISTQARHSTSAQVASHVQRGPFTAGDAAAVASWYQTPRGYGAVFASFASGCAVEQSDLLDAVNAELSDAVEPLDVLTLDRLRTWVTAWPVSA